MLVKLEGDNSSENSEGFLPNMYFHLLTKDRSHMGFFPPFHFCFILFYLVFITTLCWGVGGRQPK